MLSLSSRQQLVIGIALTLLMALTRSHHWAALHALPDASWAVFFLAGMYLRAFWVAPVLMLGAVLVDYVAITWGGVSSFCVSPAYWLLIPAYGALFLAGRVYARHHRLSWSALPWLLGSALAGAVLAELFSSGGFYFFSGRFAEPGLGEFLPRLVKYFPLNLSTMATYLGLAAVIHVAVASLRGDARHTG
ncbi:MAG: hypothetical protein CO125_13015 [Hydrogenophilales bacterium CG_4_9_14_3_um_filter_59_35]|nr:MAG: hypothetical protein COW70_11850 [Hydrogenophilales bacterium CG18_big_fil_WC_8_21_14_2_50_58_12]PJB03614.1 MAG: hypothetical protein CO125_13015 [Hydrogenophilales bacterium CG_4_9_14_3_um_filter_59_35]